MSSRRYQEDIRRIVGLQDTLRGLDEEVPRMRIEGARGIFLIGAGETKSGAAPGEDEDGNKTDPIMPDENEDNQNEDGSGTGGSGTDPAETDGSDLEIDPEDSGNYSPDDSTFGAGWASGGVSTFSDCASGKCIEIVERGGYVPPEGWDSADDPPIDPDSGYVPGFFWCPSTSKGCETGYATSIAAANANASELGKDVCSYGAVTDDTSGGYRMSFSVPRDNDCASTFGYVVRTSNLSGTIDETQMPGYEDAFPSHWPADNCIQLAPNGAGQWAASSYESPNDMTAKYSEAKSILDLCTPNGDGVQILPGADGGSVRWNYTQGRFMAISPDGRRSFGGATEITTAVAGSVAGGGAIKAVGAAVPSS